MILALSWFGSSCSASKLALLELTLEPSLLVAMATGITGPCFRFSCTSWVPCSLPDASCYMSWMACRRLSTVLVVHAWYSRLRDCWSSPSISEFPEREFLWNSWIEFKAPKAGAWEPVSRLHSDARFWNSTRPRAFLRPSMAPMYCLISLDMVLASLMTPPLL